MTESFECGRAISVGAVALIALVCGVFAEIVDDGSRGGDGLRVRVEAESGELGDAELFAQDALGVIVLEDPIFEARFDAARASEQGSLGSLEKLLRAREQ